MSRLSLHEAACCDSIGAKSEVICIGGPRVLCPVAGERPKCSSRQRSATCTRSLTFHQEIRDAIAARERLLLVVGPKAVTSDYVRQEWQFAWSEADKVVTPILRLGDYPLVPDELKLLHCEDFQDDAQYELHLDNLVRQLGFLGPATVGIHPIYLVPKSQP